MATLTQPLRDEHRELLRQVESLRVAAEATADGTPAEVDRLAGEALHFLQHELIPHATAEDEALYPVVAAAIGGPNATATMSRDHVEVGKLTAELRELLERGRETGDVHREGLRRVLYGLYALVHLHFAKEEEVYLPILDAALDGPAAARMFEAMEAAAGRAKAAAAG
jgi:hemerythrin-like domain-containing protein